MIDRLSEFIKQVETEQKFSKSGEITDARIAELAASCGAQKICVISVTIEGDYLYVAARIIDVVSKLSSEIGDADVDNYSGVSQIRSTVVEATNHILGIYDTTSPIGAISNVSGDISKTSQPLTVSKVGTDIEFVVNGVVFKMVFVEGGEFQMGSFTGDSDEKPVHSVMISDFYIGETEVTQALWKAVMGARTNQSHWYGDRLPVEKVRWTDCKEFILHLNSFLAEQLPEGYCFALPSEAQWEYCDGNRLWFSSCFSPSLAHLH